MAEKKLSTDAVAWAYKEFIEDNPERVARFKLVRTQSALAQLVYEIRTGLKMTREDLAQQAGLTAEAIEDIEESDYAGDWSKALPSIKAAFSKWVDKVGATTSGEDETAHQWNRDKDGFSALLDILDRKAVDVDCSSAGHA